MKRRTVYVDRGVCDWCGVELPRISSGGMTTRRNPRTNMFEDPAWDERYVSDMVKFVSPIDGNYVRARLCTEHRSKFQALIRLEES